MCKHSIKKYTRKTLIPAVALIIVVAIVAILHKCFSSAFPNAITTLSSYEKIKEQDWPYPVLIEHFPEQLPEDTSSARLYFMPKILQGAGTFELKLHCTEKEIEALYNKFYEKRAACYQSEKGLFDYVEKTDIPTHWLTYRFGDPDSYSYPKDFTIIILSAEDKAWGSWNHGSMSGVAINRKKQEIVYFSIFW